MLCRYSRANCGPSGVSTTFQPTAAICSRSLSAADQSLLARACWRASKSRITSAGIASKTGAGGYRRPGVQQPGTPAPAEPVSRLPAVDFPAAIRNSNGQQRLQREFLASRDRFGFARDAARPLLPDQCRAGPGQSLALSCPVWSIVTPPRPITRQTPACRSITRAVFSSIPITVRSAGRLCINSAKRLCPIKQRLVSSSSPPSWLFQCGTSTSGRPYRPKKSNP